MTWFKVDDGLHAHRKWLATSMAARGLWVTAGSWCADQLTDGHIPKHVLRQLGGTARLAAELVRTGLWDATEDGWRFHQWNTDGDGAARNPTRQDVERERAAARERQRRAREKAKTSRRDSHASNGASHGPPDPTRPDPTTTTSRGATTPTTPPVDNPPNDPSRCQAHQGMDITPPCGQCKEARIAHEATGVNGTQPAAAAIPPLWTGTGPVDIETTGNGPRAAWQALAHQKDDR